VSLSARLGSLLINALDYNPVTLWSLGGSVLAPIFSAGRLTAQVDAAAAQRDQAAYAYRNLVLTAFGEVENALSGVVRLQAQMEPALNRRDILARSLAFAHDRYQAGYASYLEELDAQRNLYQTEIDAINLHQSQLNNLVALYRALGGGWSAGAGS
jgi:multidrug efflux system outer membrane protein